MAARHHTIPNGITTRSKGYPVRLSARVSDDRGNAVRDVPVGYISPRNPIYTAVFVKDPIYGLMLGRTYNLQGFAHRGRR